MKNEKRKMKNEKRKKKKEERKKRKEKRKKKKRNSWSFFEGQRAERGGAEKKDENRME